MSVPQSAHGGRAELAHWECHRTEKLAWIVVSCLNAFLFGNAIFRCVNEILGGTLNADHGEEPKSHNKLVALRVAKISVDRAANVFGNILANTAAFYLGSANYL